IQMRRQRQSRAACRPPRSPCPYPRPPRRTLTPAEQLFDDQIGCLFGAEIGRVDVDLGVLGRLVGTVDAREVLELARTRLRVKAFDIAPLGLSEGRVDKEFEELSVG